MNIIGASLSEPHIDGTSRHLRYMYVCMDVVVVRTSLHYLSRTRKLFRILSLQRVLGRILSEYTTFHGVRSFALPTYITVSKIGDGARHTAQTTSERERRLQ